MTAKTTDYAEKLRDPRWQKKRLQILERDGWKCQVCGDKKSTLHVHHRHYRRGAEPWEYPGEELQTLCDTCHESVHRVSDEEIMAVLVSAVEKMQHERFAWELCLLRKAVGEGGMLEQYALAHCLADGERDRWEKS